MSAGGGEPPPSTAASFADEAFAVAADAYAHTPESWERAVGAAIAALFGFLSSRPAQTQACLGGGSQAPGSSTAPARHEQLVEQFSTLLRPGFAAAPAPPPPVVAEAIGGGIFELVRSHAAEGRLDELPGAASDATIVALVPFLGADGAFEVAGASQR